MKKIIALALTAAMALPTAANASAAGRVTGISDALDTSGIHILYNGSAVEYEDVQPVNTDGRVMIPFRVVLESMGATVDYDDSSRLVTASKDDTTIKFTLMDDTIYVDNNGEQSTVTMDVPMIIVEDRTLVPIRFMSNALGMQVGWDGDSQTVLVMDYDDYFSDFDSVAPNLSKAVDIEKPEYNHETADFKLDLKLTEGTTTMPYSLSGSVDTLYDSGTTQADLSIDATLNDAEIKNSATTLVYNSGVLYIKTDLIKKLAAKANNTVLSALALAIDDKTWYSVNLDKYIDSLSLSDATKAVYKGLIESGSAGRYDYANLLKSNFSTDSDAQLSDAVSLAEIYDSYEWIDKLLSVTENEDGSQSVSLKLTTDDINKLLQSMGYSALDGITLNADINGNYGADSFSQNADISFSSKSDDSSIVITFTLTDSGKADKDAAKPQVPTDSKDITSVLSDAYSKITQ